MNTAIVSCNDKTGVADFCRRIDDVFQIYSTGGTYSVLNREGVNSKPVSELTGFPEILGGRVKTLHPKILGGILARREVDSEDMAKYELTGIDLVVVNLYPFVEVTSKNHALTEAIESIDIGGVTLIRAAAKNYMNVIVVTDPSDYGWIADSLGSGDLLSKKERLHLARKAFHYTARYDTAIARYLQSIEEEKLVNEVDI